MPGQAKRKKSVRLKLNTVKAEFQGKNVLLVDDSIVRGTTAGEIVQMAKDAGAKKVYFSSAAPPIRFPNIYGIDLPSQKELIAYERTDEEIARKIGCDWVLFQRLEDLEASIIDALPKKRIGEGAAPGQAASAKDAKAFDGFDTSTFSGEYVTGQTMGDEYFQRLHEKRNDVAKTVTRGSVSNGIGGSRHSAANDFIRNNWAIPAAAATTNTVSKTKSGSEGGGSDTEDTKSDSDTTGSAREVLNDQNIRVVERIPLPTF